VEHFLFAQATASIRVILAVEVGMLSDPVAVEGRDAPEVALAGAAEVEWPGCGLGLVDVRRELAGVSRWPMAS
jgi:hypothetical protein